MARGAQEPSEGKRVAGQVGRFLANVTLVLLSLATLAAWSYFGFYTLEPGQAAVILRFGSYVETVSEPGLAWHLPPPIESHEVVNVASINREEFGYPQRSDAEPTSQERAESAMQTGDANIVHLNFVVQYRIKDAFQARFRIADPRDVLRDAAQASVRAVVGGRTIDGVLAEERGIVEVETREDLQARLDHYESGLHVLGVELLDVQPPGPVRDAFDDVLAANQDRSRMVNEAESYANEVIPRARAQAIEALEAARGYRASTIARAEGESERFRAIAGQYAAAPEVVRTRLFLEAMEDVLPEVRTVILAPGTPALPHFSLDELGRQEGR